MEGGGCKAQLQDDQLPNRHVQELCVTNGAEELPKKKRVSDERPGVDWASMPGLVKMENDDNVLQPSVLPAEREALANAERETQRELERRVGEDAALTAARGEKLTQEQKEQLKPGGPQNTNCCWCGAYDVNGRRFTRGPGESPLHAKWERGFELNGCSVLSILCMSFSFCTVNVIVGLCFVCCSSEPELVVVPYSTETSDPVPY